MHQVLLFQDGAPEPPFAQACAMWIPTSRSHLASPCICAASGQSSNHLQQYPWIIPHLEGWGIELSQDVLPDMDPGDPGVTLTVTPLGIFRLTHAIVDIEGFVDTTLSEGAQDFPPPVVLHRLGASFAEQEITVHPYPLNPGATELCVELNNLSPRIRSAVAFAWSPLGIALPFHPIGAPSQVILPPRSVVTFCKFWVPPFGGV